MATTYEDILRRKREREESAGYKIAQQAMDQEAARQAASEYLANRRSAGPNVVINSDLQRQQEERDERLLSSYMRRNDPEAYARYTSANEAGLSEWQSAVAAAANRLTSEASRRSGSYISPRAYESWANDEAYKLEELRKQGEAYKQYLINNREAYDPRDYGTALLDLNKRRSYLSGAMDDLAAEGEYRSQYSKDDWETMSRLTRYSQIEQQPDYEENSRYQSTGVATGKDRKQGILGFAMNTPSTANYDQLYYEAINGNQQALQDLNAIDLAYKGSNGGVWTMDYLPGAKIQELSDAERKTYNYLYRTDSPEAARQYLADLKGDINARARETYEANLRREAADNKFGYSLATIATSPLKAAVYANQALDYAANGSIDQNAGYNRISQSSAAVRDEISKIAESKWGKVGSFGYQTAMSMGDFLFNAAITGGMESLSLGIMGASAAADTVMNLKDQGISDGRAFALGSIAGGIEILTEKIGWDALFKADKLGQNYLKYVINNTLSEGFEEATSDVLNWLVDGIADAVTGTSESEWKREIQRLQTEENMSYDEAKRKVISERLTELGMDFAGGALSGFVMGGIGGAFGRGGGGNYVSFSRMGKQYAGAQNLEARNALMESAMDSREGSIARQVAQELNAKQAAGKTLTREDLGRLSAAASRTISFEESAPTTLREAAEQMVEGGAVDAETVEAIMENPEALAQLGVDEELTPRRQRTEVRNALRQLAEEQAAEAQANDEAQTAEEQTEATQKQRPVMPRFAADMAREMPQLDSAQALRQRAAEYDQMGRTVERTTRAEQAPLANPVITPAQRAARAGVKAAEAARATLGTEGAKAAANLYTEGTPEAQYYAAFSAYYNAGVRGGDILTLPREYSAILTNDQRMAAFKAGQDDARANLQKQITEAAKQKSVKGSMIEDDWTRANLDGRTTSNLQRLAKKFGVTVAFVDSVRGGTANAQYEGSQVLIERGNKNPVAFLIGHELTHRMQALAPEEYHRFRDTISPRLAGAAQVKGELYHSAGVQIDYDAALDEAAADYVGRLLNDDRAMQQFIDNNIGHRGLLETLKDFFRDLAAVLTGDERAKAMRAQRKIEAALNRTAAAAESQARKLEGRENATAESGGEIRTANDLHDADYSLKSMFDAAGLSFDMEGDRVIALDKNGNRVTRVTTDMVADSILGSWIAYARDTSKTITGEEAEKQIQGLTDLYNLMLSCQDGKLVWQYAGSVLFSAVKSNSDAQYNTTVDFSTVCRKTVEMVEAMSKAMIGLDRGLTKDEVTELQADIIGVGGVVPCPVCYVFSRWAGVGGILSNMAAYQEKYKGAEWDDPAKVQARIDYLKKVTAKTATLREHLAAEDEEYKAYQSELASLKADAKTLSNEKKSLTKRKNLTDAERERVAKLDQEIKANATATTIIKTWMEKLEKQGSGEAAWLSRVRIAPDYHEHGELRGEEGHAILFDIAHSEKMAEKYPLAWAYRTSRGPSAGKAMLPYSDYYLGDLTTGPRKKGEDNKFKDANARGEFNKTDRNNIAKKIAEVKAQNLIGGQRYQSTSDFRFDYGLDYLLSFLEAQTLGSTLQTYTKIIEFVDIVAAIGGDVNLSAMPSEKGYVTENGVNRLVFSDTTGINIDAAKRAISMYDSAQIILVGINDEHIKAAMADSFETEGAYIGFIIPYHASGASINNFVAKLVENLNETYNQDYYKNYEPFQNDIKKKNATAEQKRRAELREQILTGKKSIKKENGNKKQIDWAPTQADLDFIRGENVDISGRSFEDLRAVELRALAGDKAAIKEYTSWSAGILWNVYQKMWVDESAKDTYGVRLASNSAKAVMPHEYWNTNTTRANAYVNGFIFRSYCYSLGLIPRFSGIDSKGSRPGYGDFTTERGYWKTLIDRPMYARDGTYRGQQKVNVTNLCQGFQEDSAGLLDPKVSEENWKGYKVAEPSEELAAKAAEKFVKEHGGKTGAKLSLKESDSQGKDLSRGQQEYFKDSKVRDENGHLLAMYHGTNADFTIFDRNHIGATGRFEGAGFNFTPYEGRAASYGKNVLYGYVNIENPLSAGKKTFTVSALAKLIREADPTGDNIIANYANNTADYGTPAFVAREARVTAKAIYGFTENDVDIYSELSAADPDSESLIKAFEELGYDGLIHYDENGRIKTAVAFNPNQFKLADNTEPTEHDDIRYSLKGTEDADIIAALRKENESLREQVEHWKSETEPSGRTKVRMEDVAHVATTLVKAYQTKLGRAEYAELKQDIKSLYDFITAGRQGEEELTWEAAHERAMKIGTVLIDKAVAEPGDFDEGLYNYLHKTEFILDRGDRDDVDPEWNEWRKSHFGKMNIKISDRGGGNVDFYYNELKQDYPDLFPEILNPGEQLRQMAEVYDMLAEYRRSNPHDVPVPDALADARAMAAADVLESFFQVKQEAPNLADRYEAKLGKGRNELLKSRERLAALRAKKNAKINSLEKEHSAAIKELKAAQKAEIDEITQQNRERVRQILADERKAREEQEKKLRQHYSDIRERARDRREDSEARKTLLRVAQRLEKLKTTAVNRELINSIVGELDTVSVKMTSKTLQKLSDLREWYDDQRLNNPDFISDPATEKKLSRLSKKHISELTLDEVRDLTDVLRNIETEIRNAKRLIDSEDRRDTYHMGLQVIDDINASGGSRGGALDKFIVTQTLSPVREMRRVTGYNDADPLYKATLALADGQRAALTYQMVAQRPFQRFAKDKAFNRRFTGKYAEGIKISGTGEKGPVTVTISPAMRVSLYLHSLNDQNLKHIKEGGITVPDWEYYRKGNMKRAWDDAVKLKLSPSEVRAITADMTDEEMEFARAAWRYFNTVSKGAINNVSEKLVGYSIAAVENYFPINTDPSFLRKEFESVKFDGSLEGMGWTKERINAANPILLRDANEVLEQGMRMHSQYVGLAVPVRNFNKLWGVTKSSYVRDDNGNYVTDSNGNLMRNSYESSVQQAMKRKWTSEAAEYVEKLMSDVQGATRGSDNAYSKALAKIRSKYAGAVLNLNLGVAAKQAASYPTAAAVLGWGPLVKAMKNVGKVDLDLIAEYTPLQWYRSLGYSTKELGDLAAKAGGGLPTYLNWIQAADLLTTRKLWKASEYYVRDHNKDLKQGTPKYYEAVADIYNRVIEETQPNYTTMQRPQLLRTDSDLLANLAMFKTQPFQNFNILYDAAGNLHAKLKQGDAAAIKEARKDLRNAITSQAAQLAVFAAMTMAWALVRGKGDKYKDDDDELTAPSVVQGLLKDIASGTLSMVPMGTETWDIVNSLVFGEKYYGLDATAISALSDLTSGATAVVTAIKSAADDIRNGKSIDWNSMRHKLDRCAGLTSKALGVPYDNVTGLMETIATNILKGVEGPYVGKYYGMLITTDPSSNKSAYYNVLFQAYDNDRDAYDRIYSDMVKRDLMATDSHTTEENLASKMKAHVKEPLVEDLAAAVEAGDTQAQADVYQRAEESGFLTEDQLRSALEAAWKKEQGVDSVKDLEYRAVLPERQENYDKDRETVHASPLWEAASETARTHVEDAIYGLASGNKQYEKWPDKIAGGASVGLTEGEWMLFRLALYMEDEASSGSQGSYDNAEVEAAIRKVPGLSNKERRYLWTAQGKKDKSNPF